MQYINFVPSDGDEWSMHTAPVAEDDAAYLRRVIATLRPLSREDYMNGPAVVLHTLAKSSYVLDGQDVLWCVEWDPGLIVVRLSPDSELAWTAIRSPTPDFGGREADEADWEAYDDDADNPQYNLIFVPWDAQFDAQKREWSSFVPADDDTQTRFQNALKCVDELGEIMETRYSKDHDTWAQRCKQNLEEWSGEGIRLT